MTSQAGVGSVPKQQNASTIHKSLPAVNPNAIPNNRIIANTYQAPKFQYQDGNRPFVEVSNTVPVQKTVFESNAHTIPINPRLVDEYKQAVMETTMRRSYGVNYNP